ncbi:MAG TPA: hypothetical protein VF261_01350 [Candidatus Saccharimonadales bacterium]
MFGHQDEPKQTPADTHDSPVVEPVSDGTLGDNTAAAGSTPAAPAIEEHEADGLDDTGVRAPSGQPFGNTPLDDSDDDNEDSTPRSDAPTTPAYASSVDANALLDIKQQALQQLSPLVDHLEQSPEEKFRTTMMMIQASDNKDLLKTAYAAAQQISDDKERAQALLDVINEINYFTQHAE